MVQKIQWPCKVQPVWVMQRGHEQKKKSGAVKFIEILFMPREKGQISLSLFPDRVTT